MKNLSIQYKIYISIGIFILIVASGLFFGAGELAKRVIAKADIYQEKLVGYEYRKSRLEKISKLEDKYNKVSENEIGMRFFVPESKTIELIELLEKTGVDTGNMVKIEIDEEGSNLKSDEKDKDKKKSKKKEDKDSLQGQFTDFQYLKINLSLVGKYNNILNFVEKLENMEYYSDMLGISVAEYKLDEKSDGDMFGSLPAENNEQKQEGAPIDATGMLEGKIEVIFYLE